MQNVIDVGETGILGGFLLLSWILIYKNHAGIVYQVDKSGIRYLRKGKVVRNFPRNKITSIRISGKHVLIAVKGFGNFDLAPKENAEKIYQLLVR